jgi:hypothetical protein
MAHPKVFRIEKLTFVLPDTFVGDEADALLLLAQYCLKHRGRRIETPADPRVSPRKATLEVLEAGGRVSGVLSLQQLSVPQGYVYKPPSGKVPQTVVVGGFAPPPKVNQG